MSKAASLLNRGDRVATFRCNPRFMIVSSDRKTRQVDQVAHADPVGDFPQFRVDGVRSVDGVMDGVSQAETANQN
jgi:hypothetical protein